MPIVSRKPAPPTPLQKFRLLTEGLLMEVAQKDILRQYPETGASPYPKEGAIYTLLRIFFLPGFKLTPWPLRRRMMSLFFVRRPPSWPGQSGARREES